MSMVVDIEYLKGRIKEVQEVLREVERLSLKPYSELGLDEKYSLRYHVVVLVEALGSICLHISIEDFGCEPRSYPECFKLLEGKGLIDCSEDLVKMARLRNILVHRYWSIDDAKVYDSIKRNFKCVEQLIEGVEKKYGIRAG